MLGLDAAGKTSTQSYRSIASFILTLNTSHSIQAQAQPVCNNHPNRLVALHLSPFILSHH